jgi:catechol 2,3-dioxygenase-like lactoylglutathione lyase family enzyme
MRLRGVSIETADVAAASERYASLLGVEPLVDETGACRFALDRGLVELTTGEPGRATVLFARESPDDVWAADPSTHGILVRVEESADPTPAARGPDAVEAIDHVVFFTPDPARTIALWRDAIGMRLAFDKAFPERRIRLMFFRSGGLTFEFACPLPVPADADGPDRFYGVSYRVPDLAARRAALLAAGFDVSESRPGNKAGTRVASVRSGTADVPTLLLENVRTP